MGFHCYDSGSIPGQETEILQALCVAKKIKKFKILVLTVRRISVHYLTSIFYFGNYHKPFLISPVVIHVSIFVVVQSLSSVWFFAALWTATRQGSLSFIISENSLEFTSIESIMPSNRLVLCHPRLLLPSIFPSIRVFSSEWALYIRWPKYGASVSASVLPKSIQGWFPLGWTGLISVLPKELSRVVSSSTMLKHQFFSAQPSSWSNSHIHTWLLEKP